MVNAIWSADLIFAMWTFNIAVLDIYRIHVHYFRKLTQHPPQKPKVGNMWEIPLPKSPKQMSHFCSTITEMRSTRRNAPPRPRHCVFIYCNPRHRHSVVRCAHNHTTTQDPCTHAPLPHNKQFSFPAWLQQPGREVAQAGCPIHKVRGLLGARRRHPDISIHLSTRLTVLIKEGRTSCFLIVSQAWPTRNSSMPPRRPASSRLREAKSFGTPSSARTTSMAEA